MSQTHTAADCPFCSILSGEEPAAVIARDDARGFILIKSIHPESSVHWLAMPVEHVDSIEELERSNSVRFLELVDFAVQQTKANAPDYPDLERGFTFKMHFGSFATFPHAKLHVLAIE